MRFRIVPIALIAVGVTLLLGNLGIVPKEEIRLFVHTWWPLLLVGLGAGLLVLPRGACRHRACGSKPAAPPSQAGSS